MGTPSPRGCAPALWAPGGLTLVPLETRTAGIWEVGALWPGHSVNSEPWPSAPSRRSSQLQPRKIDSLVTLYCLC